MEQLDIFDMDVETKVLDKNKILRFGSFFSGYDSQAMALERLGVKYEFVCISEIDKYALKVHQALWGDIVNLGAVGTFNEIPHDLDIATWSFPCTDISLAGKQKGMVDGTRSNYGYVFLDTVKNTPREHRPKVLIMENVKALTSEKFQDDLNEIKSRLRNMGYENHIAVLNAKHYGVAQNRERVFIISILGGGYYEFPRPMKLEKRLKDYLEDEVDEKYYLSEKQLEAMKNAKYESMGVDRVKSVNDETINAITTMQGGNREPKIIESFYKNRDVRVYDECPTIRADRSGLLVNDPQWQVKTDNEEVFVLRSREDDMPRHRIYSDDSVGFTVTTNESQQPMIMIPENTKQGYALAKDGDEVYINRPHQKRGVVQDGMIQTIKTSGDDIGVVSPDLRIRKLTPREALRLMDVSEHHIDIMLKTVSNSQAYKLAGNSIVVNVLVEIFRKLF